ncbi:MAG TPA: hypothetical protein VHQ47_03895 [Phycisphaerae bacterium]|nr:hypothetical protein [Phycisphaerae bacterium]
MTGMLKIGGKKFRVIPEAEYREMQAAMRVQERQAREDAADVAEARQRLKDRKRKTISLADLKAELGL